MEISKDDRTCASISASRRQKEGIRSASLATKRGTTSSALRGPQEESEGRQLNTYLASDSIDVKRFQALDPPITSPYCPPSRASLVFDWCHCLLFHFKTRRYKCKISRNTKLRIGLSTSRAYLRMNQDSALRSRHSINSALGGPPVLDICGRDPRQRLHARPFGKVWIAGRRQSKGPGTPSPWNSLSDSREATPLARYQKG